jgi:DNA-binding response OmpR family regulator
MAKRILLVDDDRLPMQFYVRALEQEDFRVRHCLHPNEALEYAKQNAGQIDIVILDIMLPPGKYGHQETNQGLRTGVFLLADLRILLPGVPVVVLTNVRNRTTLDEFTKQESVVVIQKTECPAFELARLVTDVLAKRDTR